MASINETNEVITIGSLELTDILIQEFKQSKDAGLLGVIEDILKRLTMIADA